MHVICTECDPSPSEDGCGGYWVVRCAISARCTAPNYGTQNSHFEPYFELWGPSLTKVLASIVHSDGLVVGELCQRISKGIYSEEGLKVMFELLRDVASTNVGGTGSGRSDTWFLCALE